MILKRRLLSTLGTMIAVAAASLLIAACGSSSGGGGGVASPSASPGVKQQVKANWQQFFSGTAQQRIALLQNGQQYATQLRALSANPLAKQLKAKVQSVKVQSPTTATVRYTLVLAGQPVLRNQTGVAIKQDGTWKIGIQSFQQLLRLQQGNLPSSASSASPSATSSP